MDYQGNAAEDEDFQPSYYCRHGSYIGNPYGADYLCGWCEDGISDADYSAMMRRERMRHAWQVTWSGVMDKLRGPIGAEGLPILLGMVGMYTLAA